MEMSPYLPVPREPLPERIGKIAKHLASGAAGVGTTAATGNPLAGVGASAALEETGNRVLAALRLRGGQTRAEITMSQAARRIGERQEAGESLRDERFAADADEALQLIETALRASMNATEQRKALLIGNLLASANYDDSLSLADVIRNLRFLEALTWRQILALAWLEDQSYRESRELLGAEGGEGSRQLRLGFENELSELARVHELVGTQQEDGSVTNPTNGYGGGQITAASVPRLAPTGAGATLQRLTELGTVVSEEDLERFVNDELEVDA